MKLFYGSHMIIAQPNILTDGTYKDFGYGFYCTILEKQAKRWALTKHKTHIVNVYEYSESEELHMLQFSHMNEEWLDFVAKCRSGFKHAYDLVEGPMADDTIWNTVEDFVSGDISRSAFWELVKFKYPTHQIVFCTKEALKLMQFERSYSL